MQMLSHLPPPQQLLENPLGSAFYSRGHCTKSPPSPSHQRSRIGMPCRVQKVWAAINIDPLLLVPSQQQRTRVRLLLPVLPAFLWPLLKWYKEKQPWTVKPLGRKSNLKIITNRIVANTVPCYTNNTKLHHLIKFVRVRICYSGFYLIIIVQILLFKHLSMRYKFNLAWIKEIWIKAFNDIIFSNLVSIQKKARSTNSW